MSATSATPIDRSRGVALGLVNGDVPNDPAAFTTELAKSLRSRGISCLAVAFVGATAGIELTSIRELRSLLDEAGIRVSQYSGVNANLIHPDPAVRDEAVGRVKSAIPAASALGARLIISGAGSCADAWRESFYRSVAENFSPAAEDRAVDTLTRIAQLIEETDMLYAVECHQLSTMRSPEVIRRVLDRVDHPCIRANFDPINLLDTPYAAYTNAQRIPEMVRTVGPRYAPTCHVKDMVVTDGMPQVSHKFRRGRESWTWKRSSTRRCGCRVTGLSTSSSNTSVPRMRSVPSSMCGSDLLLPHMPLS